MEWKGKIQSYDARRDIIIPGNERETIDFCIDHFIHLANESIHAQGYFAPALSGGSTPRKIYEGLTSLPNRDKIDWSKVLLFWSDERSVSPDSPESNYYMAMRSGFDQLVLKPTQIFRMKAEEEIELQAREYEGSINETIPSHALDLVMLGMGEDGHTASLFPKTHGLHAPNRQVIANFIPQLDTWRMTLTYDGINSAKHIAIYVLGKSKAHMVKKIFTSPYNPDEYPIQKVGTAENRALWILDEEAAKELLHL